jgi:hypothetical protein
MFFPIRKGREYGEIIHVDPSGHSSSFFCEKGQVKNEKEDFQKKLNPSILKCYEEKLCTSTNF